MPSKQKVKKVTGKNYNQDTKKVNNNAAADEREASTSRPVFHGLPREEIEFLTNQVSFCFEPNVSGKNRSATSRKEYEKTFVSSAAQALQKFHMCILHSALSPEDITVIMEEYESMLDVRHGAHAIGEKDSSKRSGTRMW